jgi:TonB family protein
MLAVAAFLLFRLAAMLLPGDNSQPYISAENANAFSQQATSKAAQRKAEPLQLSQIKELIPIMPDSALAGELRNRGISFTIDSGLINELKQIGAGQETTGVLANFAANRPPTVTLRIGKTQAQAGEVIEMSANAADPDADPLDYVWTTSMGSIKGEGPTVELNTADVTIEPPPLQVTVSVTVFDGRGGSSSARQQIVVLSPKAASRPRLVKDPQDEDIGKLVAVTAELQSKVPGESPAKPEPPMAMSVIVADDYAIITLTGTSGDKTKSSGSLNITLDISNPALASKSVNGILTGLPCRVELVPIENVAELSLHEIPAIENAWGRVMARVLPKNPKLPVHFAINWKASDMQTQDVTTKSLGDARGVGDEKAVMLKQVEPEYPRAARMERVSGSVLVSVDLDEQGNVIAARTVKGPDLLREAAEKAALQCKFRPARKDGRPTKSTELIQFSFKLL